MARKSYTAAEAKAVLQRLDRLAPLRREIRKPDYSESTPLILTLAFAAVVLIGALIVVLV